MLPAMPMLENLDVSTNTIAVPDSISHLAQYKTLTRFNAAANPFADELADKLK